MSQGDLVFHFNQALFENIVPVTDQQTQEALIAKLYRLTSYDMYNQLENETTIMNKLRSDKVVSLIRRIDGISKAILILEKMEGDLLDIITNSVMTDDVAVHLFEQICECVKYCHDNGVAHLDIKPENVLFNTLGSGIYQVKLADFGNSKIITDSPLASGIRGTLQYSAPEVKEPAYDAKKADIWSLGILFHVLLTGCWPFLDDGSDFKKQHRNVELDLVFQSPEKYKNILQQMLQKDPTARPNINAIINTLKQEREPQQLEAETCRRLSKRKSRLVLPSWLHKQKFF